MQCFSLQHTWLKSMLYASIRKSVVRENHSSYLRFMCCRLVLLGLSNNLQSSTKLCCRHQVVEGSRLAALSNIPHVSLFVLFISCSSESSISAGVIWKSNMFICARLARPDEDITWHYISCSPLPFPFLLRLRHRTINPDPVSLQSPESGKKCNMQFLCTQLITCYAARITSDCASAKSEEDVAPASASENIGKYGSDCLFPA